MRGDLAGGIEGGIGGLIGTAFMSILMIVTRKVGMLEPPDRITGQALDAIGIRRTEGSQDLLASIMHFGYGAGMGAVFGLLHRRLRLRLDAGLQGVIFGTLIWAISYKGWVPALGILPPPERDRPGRPLALVLAHWVYGWTLGRCVGAAAGLRGTGEGVPEADQPAPLPWRSGRARRGATGHADAS